MEIPRKVDHPVFVPFAMHYREGSCREVIVFDHGSCSFSPAQTTSIKDGQERTVPDLAGRIPSAISKERLDFLFSQGSTFGRTGATG
jgi:hypothetical protein